VLSGPHALNYHGCKPPLDCSLQPTRKKRQQQLSISECSACWVCSKASPGHLCNSIYTAAWKSVKLTGRSLLLSSCRDLQRRGPLHVCPSAP
jgi:hypothetical protein